MRPYNEDTGYGFLRHILVRTGYHTGQIMVVLVTASPVFPSKNNFVKALRKEHPEITTIIANVNNRNTSMVLGDKQQILYGKGYIEDVLCGKTFRISPKSFYQVNKAIEFAGLTGKERVIDAYSGIGTIGMVASDNAGEVISVELNGDAVRDAVFNAKQNKVKNIRFYKEDAGDFMVKMASHKEKADVVFMDPPRSGSDKKFLHFLQSGNTCPRLKAPYRKWIPYKRDSASRYVSFHRPCRSCLFTIKKREIVRKQSVFLFFTNTHEYLYSCP